MSRPLRLEYAGALYHVTSHGGRRDDIDELDSDRQAFLVLLADVCEAYNWVCHAYCLMDNHYHLLIETPGANLSKGLRGEPYMTPLWSTVFKHIGGFCLRQNSPDCRESKKHQTANHHHR